MSGGIVLGRDLAGDAVLDVDAVVIGTGAGGSIALRELARAGLNVVALEEGAYSTPRDFNQREDEMLSRLFQDAGGRATEDLAIRVLQGRGVGGSTVHNTNLCKRTPDEILDLWARKYAVAGAGPADLRAAFETIERDLSVSEIPASMRNANNDILRAGCEALGWRGAPLKHNRVGCQQSGFCELGCSYDAKQNALKVVLPQAIEAGDTIEILRRALPRSALPELLSTVRQHNARDRAIATLFRGGKADEALTLKREDGTAILAGGDQEQVISRIADLYMERRDQLRAAGSPRTISISTLTNEDAADISRVVRARLQERGEISRAETLHAAVDQNGRTYTLPIAQGDALRLFRRTWAQMSDGTSGAIGNNGSVVVVAGVSAQGLTLKGQDGRVGVVEWRRLSDLNTGRLLLGFGHTLTIDAAQGITSGEHINALPRGSAGITAFKGYVAESRSVGTTWTVVSEAAVHEAEKRSRALGDAAPIAEDDLWTRVARDMSAKPYKALGIDLARAARHDHEAAVASFIRRSQCLEVAQLVNPRLGDRARMRMQAEAVRQQMARYVPALSEAVARTVAELREQTTEADTHLLGMKAEAEGGQRQLDQALGHEGISSSPEPG